MGRLTGSARLVGCATFLALCAAWVAPVVAQPAIAPPSSCGDAVHRQLDFWLGEWEVRNALGGDDAPAARSRVTSVSNGCAVLEDYTAPTGYHGVSLSFFDGGSGEWRQLWIDASGQPLEKSGGPRDESFVLAGRRADGALSRTTWTTEGAAGVRQVIEVSHDDGDTWQTTFDGRYRRLTAAADPSCEAVEGVAALPLDRMVLFGEMHGTDRSPAAFGAVACHVARERGELVVGLEISHAEQERLDRFLASDGGEEARRELLAGEFWNIASQDGRQSQAMLDLLEGLRGLRQQGADLEVVAFDPLPGVDLSNREEHLARRLAAARERHGDKPFVVLTGNLHARTAVGVRWDPRFLPVGARLQQAGVEVWSVDLRHAGGTAWVCLAGADGCAPRGIAGSGPPRERLLLEPFAEPEAGTGYLAALWIGSVEASPPAVEARR